MATDLAQRRLTDFVRHHGEHGRSMLHLASHAALPVVLNSELVHLLRINFFLDPVLDRPLTYIAEAELLLSPICTEIDDGLYVIEPDLRDMLLKELAAAYGLERVREVAVLLGEYTERCAPWSDRPGLAEAQQLTALSFVDPERAMQWLAQAEQQAGPGAAADPRWFVAMRRDLERLRKVVEKASAVKGLQAVSDVIAAGRLEDGVALALTIRDSSERSRALAAIAAAMSQPGQVGRANAVVEQALKTTAPSLSGAEYVDSLAALAQALAPTPLRALAPTILETAATAGRSIQEDRERVAAFITLGRACRETGQLDVAERFFQDALDLVQTTQDLQGEATALNGLGLIYCDRGNLDSAVKRFERALALYRRLGSRIGQATTLGNLGKVYRRFGDLHRALDAYEQALVLLRAVGGRAAEAILLDDIGENVLDLGDLSRAEMYFRQALALLQETGNRGGEGETLYHLGLVYDKIGDKAQAIAYHDQALARMREIGSVSGQAAVLDRLGTLYVDLGELDKALTYFDESALANSQLGNQLAMAETLEKAAVICEGLADSGRTLQYLQDAAQAYSAGGDEHKARQVLDRRNVLIHADAAAKFKVGDVAVTLEVLNLRRTPGFTSKPADDILYEIPAHSLITISGDPETADGLIWRNVSYTSQRGNTFSGWLSQAKASGTPLLALSGSQEPIRLFLSYAREDVDVVSALYERLEALGLRPWMDKYDILPGEHWETKLAQAIREADFFLAFLSAKRGYLQREYKQALDLWQENLEGDIYLVPVRLEKCAVPEALSQLQWVNLYEEDGWWALLRAIRAGAERQGLTIPQALTSASSIQDDTSDAGHAGRFVVHSFDLRLSGTLTAVNAEVLDSPGGQTSMPSVLPFTLSPEAFVGVGNALAEARQANGLALWRCAFGGREVEEIWRGSVAATGPEGLLRLRLTVDTPELAALPWELLYDPATTRFLALDPRTPITRFVRLPIPTIPWPQDRALHLLFTGASPVDLPPLEVPKEWSGIEQALAPVVRTGRLETLPPILKGATPAAVLAALRRTVDIWHFAGHVRENGLSFVTDTNEQHLVEADMLGQILAGEGVRLVVLSTCRSSTSGGHTLSVAGTLVRAGIPAVVAMQTEIQDDAALAFAGAFYDAIALGHDVDRSLTAARKAIWAMGRTEWWAPALYMRVPGGRIWQGPPAVLARKKPAPPADRPAATPGDGGRSELQPRPTIPAEPPPAWPTSAIQTLPSDLLVIEKPIRLELVRVPAGEFLMGSDPANDKDSRDDEKPQHLVHLNEHYIGKYPVTNSQYSVFVTATKRKAPGHWQNGAVPRGKEDHPVVRVTWDNAVAFCRWLAEATGRPFRLPSEAEWEKAGSWNETMQHKCIWPWGDAFDAKKCNTSEGKIGGTTPVGAYSPVGDSPCGAADMAGNVWEWTSSLSKGYPYDPEDGREDPKDRGIRVLRGGSFLGNAWDVRCAYHDRRVPYYWNDLSGFRVCVSAA